ncbi:DinB family protein [Pedobacter frigoris]|uniref:Damage-inducible protein DinB n=1 Tax=Pedobacter frigoris TaxID=2571272 RepID=A0A4U1CQA7_9SPHI|nr:hypothetical protein FA047_02300 [Pedobacter frigoris]
METDAYGIFTDVITHEFHHKGQAMTMARLLGHIPPDTDVMRFWIIADLKIFSAISTTQHAIKMIKA